MEKNKIYKPDDIITFGKNKGLSLKHIFRLQVTYIEWLIVHIDDFKIDIESFENLPKPTPTSYSSKYFGLEPIKETRDFDEMHIDEIYEFMDRSDSFNQYIDVKEIEDLVDKGDLELNPIDYKFPNRVKKINNEKISKYYERLDKEITKTNETDEYTNSDNDFQSDWDNNYFDDGLDIDQQSPEWWDSL
ncbi:hypothetical protein [Psychroflexus aestuariivivens]|uniref:hypothetical protein n=1 Tax=Psychroflexus aestuariivivens TaxID=1795040 RepID=UPI000FD8B0E9|nr:hypothetical protein [Psychroflexus aestuariivivens]